jgi:hypothetical protein
MTYACTALEFAADTYLLKLQSLQNQLLGNPGNFPMPTQVHDLQAALKGPYVHDSIRKLCRQKSYKITKIKMFATDDKAKPNTEHIRCLNLAAVKLFK